MPLLESELNQSASELLRPYLQSTLSLVSHPTDTPPDVEFKTFTPQFSVFYLQHPPNISNAAVEVSSSLVVADSFSSFLPEISDQLATDAEICFWKVVEKLRSVGRKPRRKESDKDEASEDVSEEIDGFCPPLDDVGNEDD